MYERRILYRCMGYAGSGYSVIVVACEFGMRLSCGPTERQKTRELIEASEIVVVSDWRDWFAWYPVRVSRDKCVWLEMVERQLPERLEHPTQGVIIYFGAKQYREKP